ncbi:MAG: hypothetical protein KDE31_23910, partial [Caldilineaceae bacterium]|nr:hypothetical protein [Caldilineaceae bacterium]
MAVAGQDPASKLTLWLPNGPGNDPGVSFGEQALPATTLASISTNSGPVLPATACPICIDNHTLNCA